jgi:hypothetical protein
MLSSHQSTFTWPKILGKRLNREQTPPSAAEMVNLLIFYEAPQKDCTPGLRMAS